MTPPVGGWDTQNALADMPEDRAVILDNWFPDTDDVETRPGYVSYATGMSGAVETLLDYNALDGTAKLFACNDGNIYDITSSGAVGAADVSSLTNDRWQHLQIGTAGGQFLFAVNGADTPRTYNGSTWGTASITGPTAASLVWCNLHQRRIWVGEKDSLSGWYLPVNSIGGTAVEFSFAGVARLGGHVVAMGTWTRDSGDGADDVAVFVTSEGEAIVYEGTDPSASATWSLIGVYRIGRPIGRRCIIKAAGDLVIITQDGFITAASGLTSDRSQTERVALSAQINDAVNSAVRSFGSLFGWQAILYPRGKMMIFNVPQSDTTAHQYVFNTITGAPTRFTGVNARCWSLFGSEIYFGGSDGKVYQFDVGANDDGVDISADALGAFSYFKSRGQSKSFKRVELVFQSASDPSPALDFNTDFQIKAPTGVAAATATTSAKWGVSKWGIGVWGSANQIFRGWRAIRGYGRSGSIRVRLNTTGSRVSWIATNFLFQKGGQR